MRVLMVQRFDIPTVGCAERIWRQAEELTRRGHEVTLVNYPHPEREKTHAKLRPESPQGVECVRLDRRATALPGNVAMIAALVERADLVHLWKAYPDTGIPVLWALRKHPRPLHYDWDDLEGGPAGIARNLTGSSLAGSLLTLWEREILHWADTATVASEEIRRLCLQSGFPADRIFPGPVGAVPKEADPELRNRWRTEAGRGRGLVYLGQLEVDDFPPEVLDAIARVIRSQLDLSLWIVGDGVSRGQLEDRIRALGLADRTIFTGYVPRDQAQAILAESSVFLFPLRDDPMTRCKSPLVVIEALSHGVPVVASRVGEATRMVGEAGVLVDGFATEEWAAAVESVLGPKHSSFREMASRQFQEHWTWSHSVDSLESAYKAAVEAFELSSGVSR